MPDDELPPSFEPGTGRPLSPPPRVRPPAPAVRGERVDEGVVPSRTAIPVRRPAAQVSPLAHPRGETPRSSASPRIAAPGRSTPGASRPSPGTSRTAPEVSATRAIPLTGAPAHSSGARPRSSGEPAALGAPRPVGPIRPATPRTPNPNRAMYRRRRLAILAAVLVLALAWPIGLVIWADGRVQHVDALSAGANSPGTTYLLAGSDSRADGPIQDGHEGARTDTIMLLTVPANGTPSLISLPRDTYVDIPGHGPAKLNAAYGGGAPLLVQTVEGLTQIHIDHYVEIGMGGVEQIVNAVGGVNLCWDAEVNDPDSGMVWSPGCHDVDGAQALAFARMRKADPTGDIGRGLRQQMVIQAVTAKLRGPSLLLPWEQIQLITAGTDALTTDPGTGVIDLGKMALAFRAATGPNGHRGTPPISNPDYRPGDLGSTVLLDEAAAPLFWQQVLDGTLPTQAEIDGAGG